MFACEDGLAEILEVVEVGGGREEEEDPPIAEETVWDIRGCIWESIVAIRSDWEEDDDPEKDDDPDEDEDPEADGDPDNACCPTADVTVW